MKEKIVYGLLVLFLIALAGALPLYAERDVAEIETQAGEDDSDPSAFEGDSDSMPGERAPEDLPMDDSPGVVGVGIE